MPHVLDSFRDMWYACLMTSFSLDDVVNAYGIPDIKKTVETVEVLTVNGKRFLTATEANAEKERATEKYRTDLRDASINRFDRDMACPHEISFLMEHYSVDDLKDLDIRTRAPLNNTLDLDASSSDLFEAICLEAFEEISRVFETSLPEMSMNDRLTQRQKAYMYLRWIRAICQQRFLESLCATVREIHEHTEKEDSEAHFPLEIALQFADIDSIVDEIRELSEYVVKTVDPFRSESFKHENDIFGYREDNENYVVYRRIEEPNVLDPFRKL